ncbi:DUF4376 domain-containing protein [Serratia microhaemolytica]|uniref:DUF4376 domain-containing protein n=1 Tax=Serratia microhaemolytica TaxID=2675110 RepID=UPI000FDE54EE|nr:DUF4376 domain-containing protein [Serratia microhaemolytica]
MSQFTPSEQARTLRVFNYAEDSGEYIGSSEIYLAPNAELPANCTLVTPAACPPGLLLRFDGETWQALEDHRGKAVFDTASGCQLQFNQLGALPDNLTLVKPPYPFMHWDGKQWQANLATAQQAKIAEIKAHRDHLTADYIVIDGHHFHSDTASRIQQTTLCKMGQAGQIPAGLMWQSKNNGLIELTNEIAARFEAETIAHDMRLFAAAQQHIAAVELLTELAAVINYDYQQGWQV